MIMKRWRALAAVTLFGALSTACLDDITATRPLTLEVEADPATAAVSEEITITATATGTQLREISFDFGDGSAVEEKTYPGFVEITDFVVHAYETPGTYVVTVEAVANQGTITDDVTITVN
jgi:PKD repeat protein